jgi:hypothetical protein
MWEIPFMTVSVRKKQGLISGLPRGEMRQLKEYKQTTYSKDLRIYRFS